MIRVLLYVGGSCVVFAGGVGLIALRTSSRGGVENTQSIRGGTWVAGQPAVVPVRFDLRGWRLIKVVASCGCLGLKSDAGPLVPPTVMTDDCYSATIDTTGRIGKSYFAWLIEAEKDGKSIVRRFQCELDLVPAWKLQPEALSGEGDDPRQVREFRVAIHEITGQHRAQVDHIRVSDADRIEATLVPKEEDVRAPSSGTENMYRHKYDLILKCRLPEMACFDQVTVVGADSRVRMTIPIRWKVRTAVTYKPRAIVVATNNSQSARSIWVEHPAHQALTLAKGARDWASLPSTTDLADGRRRTEVRVVLPAQASGEPSELSFRCGDREYCVPIQYLPSSP